MHDYDKKVYVDALCTFSGLLSEYADYRLRLNETQRESELRREAEIIRNADYEFRVADVIISQGASFEEILDIMIPHPKKRAQPESDFNKYLGIVSGTPTTSTKLTPHQLRKYAEKVKNRLSKFEDEVKKRFKKRDPEEPRDTIVSIYMTVDDL